MNSEKIHKMVGTGVLTAVVIVVYLLTMGISVGPFNITFALIPIVVGAALYGWATGGWLGLVFGAMVLFTGGANAFLVINVPGTIITVLVKVAAAGLVPGLIYSAGVYMVTVFVGVNFLVELGANLLLSSVIVRIVDIVKNKLAANKSRI